jgi:hypothetical protein
MQVVPSFFCICFSVKHLRCCWAKEYSFFRTGRTEYYNDCMRKRECSPWNILREEQSPLRVRCIGQYHGLEIWTGLCE